MKIKGFKHNFKIYNLKDNNIIKIYYYNYNFSKIKLEISKIIFLNNNNTGYLNNKEENLNIKKLEKMEILDSFFIILIKIFDKFHTDVGGGVENNY